MDQRITATLFGATFIAILLFAFPCFLSAEDAPKDDDGLAWYLEMAKRKISTHWGGVPYGKKTGMVEVSFTIYPKGNISTPKIVKSSGYPKLDSLAIDAINNAAPFNPFPKELKEPDIFMTLKFLYQSSGE